MLPRVRVLNALQFQPVDIVPLQVHPSPGGLYDHGQKLLEWLKRIPQDFGSFDDLQLPVLRPDQLDGEGQYHEIRTDEWGTTWDHRLYGVWGHRIRYPLADLANLADYRFPPVKIPHGEDLSRQQERWAAFRETYFHVGAGISLFETMQSLRPMEDVLIDIQQDDPQLNQLADRLVAFYEEHLTTAALLGADAITAGDDFGTQTNLILSLRAWRRFFEPRYRRLFAQAKEAGQHVLFHSCGMIRPLLAEFAALGVDAVWPQLPLYDHRELHRVCKDLGLAIQLHPDRGELMQRARPGEVRRYLFNLVEEFEILSGGSWLYLEVDPGFPWENVEMMFRTVAEIRGT